MTDCIKKLQCVEVQLNDGSTGFAIKPKEDCTHFVLQDLTKLSTFLEENRKQLTESACADCQDKKENWVCLQCQTIHCSREINSHMIAHHEQQKHAIVMSYRDLSFWCYECNSYITNPMLWKAGQFFSSIKFKSFKENLIETQTLKQVIEQKTNLLVKPETQFSYNELVQSLKKNKYENICVFLGPKASEASGVQNIKSEDSAILKQLEEINLPYPTRVFELDYFKRNPEALYRIARYYLFEKKEQKPQHAYKFIKHLDSTKKLAVCYTQNIEGLELEAGITQNKVIQVNGHLRSAKCLTHKEDVPLDKFKQILKQKPTIQQEENKEKIQQKDELIEQKNDVCLIKPDLILFGECLPQEYFLGLNSLRMSDLVFVVGVDLSEMPFASCIKLIQKNVPFIFVETQNIPQDYRKTLIPNQPIEGFFEKLLEDLK